MLEPQIACRFAEKQICVAMTTTNTQLPVGRTEAQIFEAANFRQSTMKNIICHSLSAVKDNSDKDIVKAVSSVMLTLANRRTKDCFFYSTKNHYLVPR